MKTTIMAVSLILAANTAIHAQAKTNKAPKQQTATATRYTCSMHPEVVQSKPGKCPKCNMDLAAKKEEAVTYTCSMHPEVVQTKPGKCPRCEMTLMKITGRRAMKDSADLKL